MLSKLFKKNSNPKIKNKKVNKPLATQKISKDNNNRVNINKPVPNIKPKPNKGQLNINNKEIIVPTNTSVSKNPNIKREFQYTKPLNLNDKKELTKEIKVETITDERLITKRPVLETVSDLNEVSLFQKINLVNYFNLKESGKIDERIAKDEYRKNSEKLKKETSLLYFLRESAKRHLEYNEVKGYRKIDIRIDPQYSLEDINRCIQSKLLASYKIEVIHNNDLLSRMGVDPIVIRMTLKKM